VAKKKSSKKAAKKKAPKKAKGAAKPKAKKKKTPRKSTALARPRKPAPPQVSVASEAAAALFPPEEIERLKLVALTSARREDKIEALRRLAYSPLSMQEKADIFLGRLADPDADIRIEAAQLLRGIGLDGDIAEAIRELEHGEEAQKLFAIDRLGRRMALGAGLDVGAGLIALVWRLREERTPAVRRQLLERLEEAAPVIASAPARAEELTRLLVTLFASDPIGVGSQARRLVRKIGAEIPGVLREVLWGELDSTSAGNVRVFILQLLCALADADDDERLPEALARQIATAEESDVGFRTLGDQLVRLGDVGVRALLAVFPGARLAQQTYIARLVTDTSRFTSISAEVKEEVASLFLNLLSGHQREVQMCVVQTQFPMDRDLSDETRAKLADQFLAHIHLFGFQSDIENIEGTIAQAGLAAIEPLVERLGPRSSDEDRVRAARVLGELALREGERAAAGEGEGDATRDALLESLGDGFPNKTVVFAAMGKVVSAPVIPAETVELVARNLLERRDAEDLGYRVLEALGHLAASPHVNVERVDQIEKLFRAQLEAELPDIATEQSEEEGVAVFEIGAEAEMYTDAVPAAVRGLAHIALGRSAATERVAAVTGFLLDLWEKVASGELQWGPPGASALVSALTAIASGERVGVEHKVAVVKSFARKMGQVPALEALGVIFASEDRSVDLGRLAAAAGIAILRRRVDGKFPEEDREHCLRVLASIIGRQALDCSTELTRHLREDALEELFDGIRDNVEGAYEMLAKLRANERLDEEFRETIQKRLSAYEQLVVA